MKKRGQAFLITAVIFIAIISAFITIHNFSKKTTFSTFSYIAEEIQIESEKVMDYVLVSGKDVTDDFTQKVSDYAKKEDIDIYFITDNSCYNYLDEIKIPLNSNNCQTTNDLITATIDGTNYNFPKYSEGKHFYFVMIKEKEDRGEKYVYTDA